MSREYDQARARLIGYLAQAGLSTARANANLNALEEAAREKTAADRAVEYGILVAPGQVLDPSSDRSEAEQRCQRYRSMHPDAEIVARTVTYGDWTPPTTVKEN